MFQLPVRHASGQPAASSLFSGNLYLTKEIERLPEYLPDPPRERDTHERPRAYEAKNESSGRRGLRALGHGASLRLLPPTTAQRQRGVRPRDEPAGCTRTRSPTVPP